MTFKSMSAGRGVLFTKPAGWTHDWSPEPGDLYRYALSHPGVDVVLTGPRNRREIDHALAAVARGPLSAEEMQLLDEWGDLHRAQMLGPQQEDIGAG
jgi:predicted aldo/keto reductase-like oxidoreductase